MFLRGLYLHGACTSFTLLIDEVHQNFLFGKSILLHRDRDLSIDINQTPVLISIWGGGSRLGTPAENPISNIQSSTPLSRQVQISHLKF